VGGIGVGVLVGGTGVAVWVGVKVEEGVAEGRTTWVTATAGGVVMILGVALLLQAAKTISTTHTSNERFIFGTSYYMIVAIYYFRGYPSTRMSQMSYIPAP
jgi:hypothetical protein